MDATYSLVSRRIVPILLISYVVSFLDRVNIGFAKLQMAGELGYSDAVYGFGAGIFFLGYFIFEVPSNLILERVGARVWIARIMVTWGIVSSMFAFVDVIPWGPLPEIFDLSDNVFSLYALRFLLGVSEAGFFPGVILYLTYWYPEERRGRIIAMFMTGIAIANVIGGPLSGFLMEYLHGAGQWHGWRWLFIIEAIPSMIMGVVVFYLLPNGPRDSTWLTEEQRQMVLDAVDSSNRRVHHARSHSMREAFTNPRIWQLSIANMAGVVVLYGVNFWMPTIISEMGITSAEYLKVGLISMIPWGLGGLTMVYMAARSDRTQERRWHTVLSVLVAAVGLVALGNLPAESPLSIVALCITTCGSLSFCCLFWNLPTMLLRGSAAAAGIAMIVSVTNLGGHIGPEVIGQIRMSSYSNNLAFYFLAACAVFCAGLILYATRQPKTSD
ncbi:MAG: MFS transporter [Candidatus Kapabacteria bacterium]|nr:MFS transporter [Candidatus Kapabacteria bacterium]